MNNDPLSKLEVNYPKRMYFAPIAYASIIDQNVDAAIFDH